MELDNLPTTNQYKLLKVLGCKCRLCPISEVKDLEIDHIYDDGADERTKYGSSEKIWGWYLEHQDQAFRRLQPLCKEHHNEKHHPIFSFDFEMLPGKPRIEVSNMQSFMDVLKGLEGDNMKAVEESYFVSELEKTEKFTAKEARDYIRRMLREASIYESKPGHYNRV